MGLRDVNWRIELMYKYLFILLMHKTFARVYNDVIQECATEVNQYLMYSYSIPYGIKNRALRTVPPGFTIRKSNIAGLGVFSDTFVRKYTWLAEYDGVRFPLSVTDQQESDAYQWMIYGGSDGWKPILKNDALDEHTSNWIRYINCARNGTELNVWPHWCYHKVYYMTTKDLYPTRELLTYYGPDFASTFNIDTSTFPDFN